MSDSLRPEYSDPQPQAQPGGSASDEALYAALVRADRSESLVPLSAGLARELNEVLARILGGVILARARGDLSGLDQAELACLSARDLTRRLLALGEGGDGTMTAVPVGELLAEAAQVAGAGSAAEITIECPDTVPAVWVDRPAMVQAVRNLVRNAVEAMVPTPPRPRIQLGAGTTTLSPDQVSGLKAGDYVEVEVRDNANGIAPENLERIWEPFFTTKKHGAGLGLPTTLAVVRRHGGQIGVDSTVGVGTVFTLFLPPAKPFQAVRTSPAEATRFRTGRVLVLDDDPQYLPIAGSLLEALGYKCDLVRAAEEALEHYRRYLDIGRPYDAVILDLTLRGGPGGEEAFARLRLLDPDVRAIACGGGDAESLSKSCLEAGFRGWLAKPYRLSELGEVIKDVLG